MKQTYLVLLFGLISCFTACTKKTQAVVPNVAFANDTFKVVEKFTSIKPSVNFFNEYTYFTARFNESVNWKITLIGKTSQAKKEFFGKSNYIDSSFSYWDGSTDRKTTDLNIFQRGELVTAILDIFGLPKPIIDTIHIIDEHYYGFTLPHSFRAGPPKVTSVNLAAGFESGQSSIVAGWYPASVDPGDNMTTIVIDDPSAPQGNKSLLIEGTDKNSSYYIGGFGINNTGRFKYLGTSNTDSLYFNILVYGNGVGNAAKLLIQFSEGDGDNNILEIVPNHIGWKAFSVKYSTLKVPDGYQKGNMHPDDDLRLVAFMLGTTDALGKTVSIRIDNPIFTVGKPLYEDAE